MTGCIEHPESKFKPGNFPDDPYYYVNNIYNYWSTEKYDTAVFFASRLMDLKPQLLIESLHHEMALGVAENQREASLFVEKLYAANIPGLDEIIEPLSIWNKIHQTTLEDSLLVLFHTLSSILTDRMLSESKPELYTLKSLKELTSKGVSFEKERDSTCLYIIEKLEKYLGEKDFLTNKGSQIERAYIRIILSNAYYNLSTWTQNEFYLKMAANYSVDNTDRENIQGYFYPSVILTGDYQTFGFQQEYLAYLLEQKRNTEALNVLSVMAINEPISKHVITLKALYERENHTLNFKKYWYKLIDDNSSLFPDLTFTTIDGSPINSKEFPGHWTLIDVWGTWCVPCVSELPDLESFYRDSLRAYNNQLKLLTLSSNSKNIHEFMDKNSYTFPVAEVDKAVIEKLKINGFPTKLLISPSGKYRIIPFNSNWIEYINNLTLLKNDAYTG